MMKLGSLAFLGFIIGAIGTMGYIAATADMEKATKALPPANITTPQMFSHKHKVKMMKHHKRHKVKHHRRSKKSNDDDDRVVRSVPKPMRGDGRNGRGSR